MLLLCSVYQAPSYELNRLAHRRKLHVAQQMHKFVNKTCPESCSNLFQPLNEHRIRHTRSENDELLMVPKRRLVFTERGIRYFGVVIWNSVPNDIRHIAKHSTFTSQLIENWQMG